MLNKLVLENGLRIVWEKLPQVRSVSIGIWVGTGSRNEDPGNNGISHFIEHMLFKGTDKRSARDIAESIDSIGGQINAFTGKECTCFYTKTLDSHINIALDILADMFFNSKFAKRDIDVERKVILEEIGMYEDSPEDLVQDIFSEMVWNGNSLGYPILGTSGCLAGIDADAIRNYMNYNYTPQNTVLAIAGNFDESKLEELIRKYFGSWKSTYRQPDSYKDVSFVTNKTIKEKDTEQAHLCIGFNGMEQGNELLY
jgi:predicted Zn-dependent peptidase